VIPGFIAFALIAFAVSEPERPKDLRQVRFPLHRAEIGRLPVAFWFGVGVSAGFTHARVSEAFLVLKSQAVGLPIALVPAVMVVMNVVYALAAYPAGVISDGPGGRDRVLVIGLGLLVAADVVLAMASNVALTGLGVVLWGLHMGLTQGLLSTLVADAAPAELRGTAFGIFNLVSGVALLVASVVAGALWDWFGPQATFLTGAAFTAVALVGFLAIRRRFLPEADA
ncbi:MAG: MFS transporter, partial [Tabrizicola sp.]